MATVTLRWIIKNALRKIGINSKRISAHSLRHTAITLSLKAGCTIQEAKILARHASVDTTLIYAHNINRVHNAPEKKLKEFLKE